MPGRRRNFAFGSIGKTPGSLAGIVSIDRPPRRVWVDPVESAVGRARNRLAPSDFAQPDRPRVDAPETARGSLPHRFAIPF